MQDDERMCSFVLQELQSDRFDPPNSFRIFFMPGESGKNTVFLQAKLSKLI